MKVHTIKLSDTKYIVLSFGRNPRMIDKYYKSKLKELKNVKHKHELCKQQTRCGKKCDTCPLK